jgi:predicted RNA binding protein YcfA (HicA-like mRNA interferase family)
MSRWKRTLERVLDGQSDANIRYGDLCQLLVRLGYTGRQSGSHHIFRFPGRDLINLQDSGGKAKAYQVRQVREQLQKSKP